MRRAAVSIRYTARGSGYARLWNSLPKHRSGTLDSGPAGRFKRGRTNLLCSGAYQGDRLAADKTFLGAVDTRAASAPQTYPLDCGVPDLALWARTARKAICGLPVCSPWSPRLLHPASSTKGSLTALLFSPQVFALHTEPFWPFYTAVCTSTMKPFSAPLLEGSLTGTPLMTTILLGCSVRAACVIPPYASYPSLAFRRVSCCSVMTSKHGGAYVLWCRFLTFSFFRGIASEL